jgi:hypothetical protein
MVIFYSYVSVPEGITRHLCWESLGDCICIDKTSLLVASCCESSIFVFVYFCWVQLVNAGISNMSVKSSTSPNSQNSMKGQSESTIFRGVLTSKSNNVSGQMFPSSQSIVPWLQPEEKRSHEGQAEVILHVPITYDNSITLLGRKTGRCWEVILGWCRVYLCKYLCM